MNTITDFSFDADELRLTWTDGRNSKLDAIWLRDHCQMPASRDPVSGQRLINITDIDPEITIKNIALEDDDYKKVLIVTFSTDDYQSHFTSSWLLENCYCLNEQSDSRSAKYKQLWHGSSFNNDLPKFNYAEFCDDLQTKITALKAVKDLGFCLLQKVPCEDKQVLKVIQQFGFIRDTNYGEIFEVRSKVNANNLAYTNLGLGCHLDNPYRDPVPGIQLLHCLQSTTEGGESILQDAFMATQVLKEENPEHFKRLSQEYINFRFQDSDADLYSRVPMIEINDKQEVVKVRFNNRSIDTIKLAPKKIRPFYQAYRHFAEILEREDQQIHFKLEAGELMLFDNTRILHARKAYSKGGTRHLQGAYSDLDGLYSTLSVLQRNEIVAE